LSNYNTQNRLHFFHYHAFFAAFIVASCVFPAQCSLLDDANRLYDCGRILEAIRMYKKASISGENPALCSYNTANAYYQLDSLPCAILYYRTCIHAAPRFYKAYLNLAVVYFTLNDIGNCIATIREGLTIEPLHQKGTLLLATAYRQCGSIAQSILTFEELARAYPEMEEPSIALGEMYRDLDDPMAATQWLESYPSNGKNAAYVALALADLFESVGNLERTLYYLDRSYNCDQTKKLTLYRIALTQQKMGNQLVALETARSGFETFRDFYPMAMLAGTIEFSRGYLAEAEKEYLAAEKLGSAEAIVGLENVRNSRRKLEKISVD
jgi:tetratricopeptide (TPR) repeat protein